MAFEIPRYSRSSIDQAGYVISEQSRYSAEEVMRAHEILKNWRSSHLYPINTFQATLRNRVSQVDVNGLVAQRLKRAPSILNKLTRFESMRLSQMQDIGGVRAVVASIEKVRELEKLYRNGGLQHRLMGSSKDYISKPKSDGYRCVHLIFKYKNDKNSIYDSMFVEVQIRTRLQHAWATAVETMGTFLGQALKAGQGEKQWHEFFALTGSAIAHIEKTPLVPGYDDLSKKETYVAVKEIEDKLGVLEKLRGFSIAADHITTGEGRGKYHLIILNSDMKTVEIRPYAERSLQQASDDYADVERRAEEGEKIEAVLVAAGSVDALKHAYPNYFLDTHEFIHQVKRMLSEANKHNAGLSEEEIVYLKSMHGVRFGGKCIPQSNSLDSVRDMLVAIERGAQTAKDLCGETGVALRHVGYRVSAARILSCIDEKNDLKLSSNGKAWLRRGRGTEEEAKFLRELIENATFFNIVSPRMFNEAGFDSEEVALRIMMYTDLSESTARRRAQTLRTWSNKIRQMSLFDR